MTELHIPGGKARASTATRGRGGQFLPENPADTQHQHQRRDMSSSSTSSSTTCTCTSKTLSLKCLPRHQDWWDALAEQYPGINLHAELLKAMDWHRADRVKSPKLFFRNWVERAAIFNPPRDWREDLTPDQIRARLRVV